MSVPDNKYMNMCVRLQEQQSELHEESMARIDLQVEAMFPLIPQREACDVSQIVAESQQ